MFGAGGFGYFLTDTKYSSTVLSADSDTQPNNPRQRGPRAGRSRCCKTLGQPAIGALASRWRLFPQAVSSPGATTIDNACGARRGRSATRHMDDWAASCNGGQQSTAQGTAAVDWRESWLTAALVIHELEHTLRLIRKQMPELAPAGRAITRYASMVWP